MKRSRNRNLSVSILVGATMFTVGTAHGQTSRFDELSNLPFEQNRPTPDTAKTLMDELTFQQATQAYLWAMPLINTLGMKFGSEEVFGAGYNILPVWKERLDPKTLVTTPNSDVLYAMGYVDMGETGPIVFEAPPNLQGILLDFWQRPIPVDGGKFFGDVGLPGPDAGKGGKFLVLPPGYSGDVPTGYYVYRSGTNNLFILLRAFYQDPKDLSPAVALMEQAKIYPLNLPEAERKPMPDIADGSPKDAHRNALANMPWPEVTRFRAHIRRAKGAAQFEKASASPSGATNSATNQRTWPHKSVYFQ